MTDPLAAVLERYWGYTSFRPLQREAMDAVLSQRDSVVVMPTGGGKSLCFQAPALVQDGLAIVVSPLIALMKDQVDTLVGNGVPAAGLHSAMPPSVREETMRGLGQGRYRML
jgi:ATP-dependent DNA helicase RecQ